jgi:hypothetical protein
MHLVFLAEFGVEKENAKKIDLTPSVVWGESVGCLRGIGRIGREFENVLEPTLYVPLSVWAKGLQSNIIDPQSLFLNFFMFFKTSLAALIPEMITMGIPPPGKVQWPA